MLEQLAKRWCELPLWRAVLLVFLLALGIRLAFFHVIRHGSISTPDTPGYLALADSMRTHGVYSTETSSGAPGGFPADLQRPPGYPFFLYLLNPRSEVNLYWTALVQSILGAFVSCLLMIWVRQMTDAVTGGLTGVFYATDWITILYTPIPMAELLFSVTLMLAMILYAFYLLRREPKYAWLAGAVLGGASLVKPVAQVHLLSFTVAWLLQARRRWIGLAFLVSYAICVLPWMVRNNLKYRVFTLSAIPVASQYFYTAEGARGDLNGAELDARIAALEREWAAKELPPDQRVQSMRAESWRLIRLHWPVVLRQAFVGFLRTCFGTGVETLRRVTGRGAAPISPVWHTAIPMLQLLIFYGGAVAGFVRGHGFDERNRRTRQAVLGLIVCHWFFSLVPAASPAGYSRFRVHAMPALCLLAAMGVSSLLRRAGRTEA